jgi:EAL domain-containing protein (putative c-di-GMP-specific phosphodiesterase class I)
MSLNHDRRDTVSGIGAADDQDIAWGAQVVPPVAFAVGIDALTSQLISSAAASSKVRCEVFANCAALNDGLSSVIPDLIFLDVSTEGTNAVEVLHALSQRAYPGILQLVSQRGVSMVELISQLAKLHSLKVNPPLANPVDKAALAGLLRQLTPIVSQTKLTQIRLDDAINNGWVKFWYQPKINLQDKTLVGVEAFIRLFHPHKGLMSPADVLKDADEASLTSLLHYGLLETSAASQKFADLGLKMTVSINSTIEALRTLSATPTFRDYVATTGLQRNWIFDVSEEDIAKHRPVIKSLGPILRNAGVKLAIDNFGGALVPPLVLAALPISEIKLSPKFVAQCHTDSQHAEVCKAVINLAHELDSQAVAIGVESSAQSDALVRMGCDVGQGFLYGHPLPLEQLLTMIRQRSIKNRANPAARAS